MPTFTHHDAITMHLTGIPADTPPDTPPATPSRRDSLHPPHTDSPKRGERIASGTAGRRPGAHQLKALTARGGTLVIRTGV